MSLAKNDPELDISQEDMERDEAKRALGLEGIPDEDLDDDIENLIDSY